MRKIIRYLGYCFCYLFILSASYAMGALKIGVEAPGFSLTDSNGVKHILKDYADKTVILEWTNHECPYVVKHYDSKNMQGLQKKYTQEGAVWLSVISSAPGKQGNVGDEEANEIVKNKGAAPTAVLMDPSGEVGRLYKARTTPHMYIIDKGKLVYMGGIDNIASTNKNDIAKATNYVDKAMAELAAGKPVTKPVTRPYGCSVKY